MIKYIPEDTQVTFDEIPEEVSLCLNISNCQNNCVDCHSPYLRKNIGKEITPLELEKLITENSGITCICIMGEGNDPKALLHTLYYIKKIHPELSLAIYSGSDEILPDYLSVCDYIKIGSYKKEFGPLTSKTTNQRLYYNDGKCCSDITYKFWKNENS